MEDSKIINGNCWVAYFDILGFSNLVNGFPVEYVREKYKEALKQGEQFNEICKFKFFSDSFIFYTKNDSQDSFISIRDVSMFFFTVMLTDNKLPHFPMRGCLNVGQLYVDEKDDFFFGNSLIKAHQLAEGQNWIGFVLSEEAIAKIKDYELSGAITNNDRWFQEYNVLYKNKKEPKKLFVYKMNFFPIHAKYPNILWDLLPNMEHEAFLTKDKNLNRCSDRCSECKRVFTKYRNTEDYLLSLYPILKNKKRIDQNELCIGCKKQETGRVGFSPPIL